MKTIRPRPKSFLPKEGRKYTCAFCTEKVPHTVFCYGCRHFVCFACEAYDSIASQGGKHSLEAHRQCRACYRPVRKGRIGSWLWTEPDCRTRYAPLVV